MMEMRWLTYEEEETVVPPTYQIQFGKPFEKAMVTKRKLQYRQHYDSAVRAGMGWDANSLAQTAKMVWSDWKDVPEVTDGR